MGSNQVKALSPLLAAVILLAFTMTVAIFVGSSISSLAASQKEKTAVLQKCTHAGLVIKDVSCNNKILSVAILNTGDVELSNFTLYAKINGKMVMNSSAENSRIVLSPGEGAILRSHVSASGEVEVVNVYSATCPGVFAEITNKTAKVLC